MTAPRFIRAGSSGRHSLITMKELLAQIARRCAANDASSDEEMWRPSAEVLQSAWPELAGQQVAAVSRLTRVDWDDGILTVAVGSEPWRAELQNYAPRLLGRLRDTLPWHIERIRFVVSDAAVDDTDPSARASGGAGSAPPTGSSRDRKDRPADEDQRVDPAVEDDDQSALDSLPSRTADSARGILEHIRQDEDT